MGTTERIQKEWLTGDLIGPVVKDFIFPKYGMVVRSYMPEAKKKKNVYI